MNEVALELKDVGVCYRKGLFSRHNFWAIRDLSLTLYRGENLAVIGRNGSGKSTLLKLLTGIYSPDEGIYDNFGHSASLLSLQVGFVPHLSGRQNAILSGMLLGRSQADMVALMPQIIEYSDLVNAIDQPLRTYSSGMKARLGFAVSHYADADILLIDEILGVGDTAFREKSAQTMRERIESNQTVVMVSHNSPLLRLLCSRVLWLERGRVRELGGIDVLDRYEASFKEEALNL